MLVLACGRGVVRVLLRLVLEVTFHMLHQNCRFRRLTRFILGMQYPSWYRRVAPRGHWPRLTKISFHLKERARVANIKSQKKRNLTNRRRRLRK